MGYIIGENLVPIGVNYQSDVTSKATQLKENNSCRNNYNYNNPY